jgi:hypothetical protein
VEQLNLAEDTCLVRMLLQMWSQEGRRLKVCPIPLLLEYPLTSAEVGLARRAEKDGAHHAEDGAHHVEDGAPHAEADAALHVRGDGV